MPNFCLYAAEVTLKPMSPTQSGFPDSGPDPDFYGRMMSGKDLDCFCGLKESLEVGLNTEFPKKIPSI